MELGKFWFKEETNKWVCWHERYLVVYSPSLAASAIRSQQQRINTAQTALNKLSAKPGQDREQLTHKVENIKKRYRVSDLFSTIITQETLVENRHVGRGRPSKNSPTESVTSISLQLHIHPIDTAIKEAETLAGWRLYVTNAPSTQLTLPQAVMYYRDEWLLERGFHRFKRGSLPALPIYFQNQHRITGLMFVQIKVELVAYIILQAFLSGRLGAIASLLPSADRVSGVSRRCDRTESLVRYRQAISARTSESQCSGLTEMLSATFKFHFLA
ncbi:MAG: hypothetical protein V7L29_34290 [Nostoc sp.]